MSNYCAFADEPTLVAALRKQDSAAYDYLVRTYQRRLLAVARRLLASEEDAPDAVQSTFLAAFHAIGTFEHSAKLSTWLHSIVINAALMILRAKRRHPEQPHDPVALEQLQNHPPSALGETVQLSSPELLLLQRETCTLVRSCIACLSSTAWCESQCGENPSLPRPQAFLASAALSSGGARKIEKLSCGKRRLC